MISYKAYTNIGDGEKNEDSYAFAFFGKSMCFAVADGLGGHGGGEIASRCAVDAVCMLFGEKGFSNNFFEEAFRDAQKSILQMQEELHAPSRLKTTLVILVIHDGKAYWAHVGDSRAYLFKRNKVIARTIDHSVPQMLVLSKKLKESEIRNHPDRNRLMRVLGIKGEVPRFEVGKPIKLTGNQAFLLCSDGYWELIDEKEMEKCLKKSADVEQWLEQMNEVVVGNGRDKTMDNFTAFAIKTMNKKIWGK